jgi:hypothetical protein
MLATAASDTPPYPVVMHNNSSDYDVSDGIGMVHKVRGLGHDAVPTFTTGQTTVMAKYLHSLPNNSGGDAWLGGHHSNDDKLYVLTSYVVAAQSNPQHDYPGNPHTPNVPNPLKTVEDLISFLTAPDTAVRVGEFIVGAVLVAVGIRAALGQSLSSGVKATGRNTISGAKGSKSLATKFVKGF